MFSEKNKISRFDFIKTSGAALGGFVTLSHYACSVELSALKKLIIEGKTDYSIVLPTEASVHEQNAAKTLQFFLSKMSISLEVINEQKFSGENAFYLGKTDYAKDAEISAVNLDEDGYLFKPLDNNLILSGGTENGLTNGVYSLLESFGYRKYSADEPVIIPKATSFNMPKEEMKVPRIKYRTTNYYLSLIHISEPTRPY